MALHRELRLVALAGGIAIPIDDFLWAVGLDPGLTKLVGSLTGWVFVAIIIAAIWRCREPVARMIRGHADLDVADAAVPEVRIRNLIARAWHIPMTAYVIAIALTVETAAAVRSEELVLPAIGSLLLVVAVFSTPSWSRCWTSYGGRAKACHLLRPRRTRG